jgi:hypothetical protein
LQGDAVLGFVFKHIGPALAQGFLHVGPFFHDVGGLADEVVEVERALAVDDGLVEIQ